MTRRTLKMRKQWQQVEFVERVFRFFSSLIDVFFFQLESLSHDELIKLIKSQFLSKKKLETQISELTEMNTNLCQSEEVNSLEENHFRSKEILL